MASPVGTRLRQQRECCAAAKVKIPRKARCEPALCEVLSTLLRRRSGERRRTRVAEPKDACAGPSDACQCAGPSDTCAGPSDACAGPMEACAGPTDACAGADGLARVPVWLPKLQTDRLGQTDRASCRRHGRAGTAQDAGGPLAWPARARTLEQTMTRRRGRPLAGLGRPHIRAVPPSRSCQAAQGQCP